MSGKHTPGTFDVVPRAMTTDLRMSATAVRVVNYIASFGDRAFPSYERIAKKLGIGRRTAIRAVECAATCGYLKKIARMDERGDPTSNAYRVNFEEGGSATHDTTPAEGVVPPVTPPQCHQRHQGSVTHGTRVVPPVAPYREPSYREPVNETQLSENARERATPPQAGLRQKKAGRMIPDDWTPSDATVATLTAQRPDLIGETYDLELTQFRLWAAANAVVTHNFEATFLRFMLKAHLSREAEAQRVLAEQRAKREADAHEARQDRAVEPAVRNGHDQPKETPSMSDEQAPNPGIDSAWIEQGLPRELTLELRRMLEAKVGGATEWGWLSASTPEGLVETVLIEAVAAASIVPPGTYAKEFPYRLAVACFADMLAGKTPRDWGRWQELSSAR
jgi:hypothetical protein